MFMNTVELNWLIRQYNTITNNESPSLYMFTRGVTIIYIGIAYRTGLKAEIDQNINRLKLNISGMAIWTAKIVRSSYGRVTEDIYFDSECLNIFVHKVTDNVQCNENYSGRDNLKVFNHNCPRLHKWVKCASRNISHSAD